MVLGLDADVYRPDTQEELPILLMRQPYGRAIASTVVYAHPMWYAACWLYCSNSRCTRKRYI